MKDFVKNGSAKNSTGNSADQEPLQNEMNSEERQPEESVEQEIAGIDAAEKQLELVQKEIAGYKEMLLRKSADFDNFRKRAEREKAQWVEFANEKLLLNLLPVLDDLERSLAAGKESHANDAFYEGVQMIYQKFLKFLESAGVKPMRTSGEQFNVEFHEAVMQTPRTGVAPHSIIEEVQRGYLLNGKVLRHAQVIVAAEQNDSTGGQ